MIYSSHRGIHPDANIAVDLLVLLSLIAGILISQIMLPEELLLPRKPVIIALGGFVSGGFPLSEREIEYNIAKQRKEQ